MLTEEQKNKLAKNPGVQSEFSELIDRTRKYHRLNAYQQKMEEVTAESRPNAQYERLAAYYDQMENAVGTTAAAAPDEDAR